MNVKEYLKLNKKKIKYGLITLSFVSLGYVIGEYAGTTKATITFKKPLLTFLSKDDYKKFCDHFDEFYNIKRG